MVERAASGRLRLVTAILLPIVLLTIPLAGEPYYTNFATRILIYGLAAISLDIIVGYGGMVSFGHATFVGLGVYAMGILSIEGFDNGFVVWPLAVAVAAIVALAIGALSLRTRGVYFIMVTFAFSQMFFYVALGLERYGGADGMRLRQRSGFSGAMDISQGNNLYYAVLAIVFVCVVLSRRLMVSPFGLTLRGIRQNEARMRSIGIPVYAFRLAAFVISGAMGGLAGVLLANLDLYFSPASFEWLLSGNLLVMVLIGGLGTITGAVIGAAIYLVCSELLSQISVHWMVAFGPMLILVVLFAKKGVFGMLMGPRFRSG
jgi:branched-chain amino acid transport system permease protein